MKSAYLLMALLLTSTAATAKTFGDYDCTSDCSGHEAGYEWASKQDITEDYECGGNSNSFVEGCRAFVEDNADDDSAIGDDDSGYNYRR